MPEADIANAVQLLTLMFEFFADYGHWTRGRYDDENFHCPARALLHLSRKYSLPRVPAIAVLQDAMRRPGLPLVHFNDTCCGSLAELRAIIFTARCLTDDHTAQERADAAIKAWLLARSKKTGLHPRQIPRMPLWSASRPNASPHRQASVTIGMKPSAFSRTRAGLPKAVPSRGTSRVTTLPAPITASSPMLTDGAAADRHNCGRC